MSYMDSTTNGNGGEEQCDQNGNFSYTPNTNLNSTNPKTSVLQILSDTLRRSQSGSEHEHIFDHHDHTDIVHSTGFSNHFLQDLSTHHIFNERPSSANSEFNFNPGDTLSSSFPSQPLGQDQGLNLIPPNPEASNSKARNGRPSNIRNPIPNPNPHQCKQCHLSTVLGSARRCLKQLIQVKEGLSCLASQDERLSKGNKISNPGPGSDYELIATLGEYIMYLTRQAFTPAHRLYTAALGLHMSEDLIRNPTDPTLLNFKTGHIVRPSWNSIIHTQMKLRACVDSATEMYHKFGRGATSSSSMSGHHVFQVEQMQHVMVTVMHAFQDLYATALGSTDIFKVLLHIEDYGETILQEFLLSLESIERSDLLLQVQALRRSFDDIVIMLEQLSWAAYAVYRLSSGKSLTPSPDGSIYKLNGEQGIVPGSASGPGSKSQNGHIVKADANGNPNPGQYKPSTSKTSMSTVANNVRSKDSKSRESLLSSSSKHHGRHVHANGSGQQPSGATHYKDLAGYSQHQNHHPQQQQGQRPHRSSSRQSTHIEHSHTGHRSHKESKDRHNHKVGDSGHKSSKRHSHHRAKSSVPTSHPATTPPQGRSRKNSLTSVHPHAGSYNGNEKPWTGHGHGHGGHSGSKSSVTGSGSKTSSVAGGNSHRKIKSKSRN